MNKDFITTNIDSGTGNQQVLVTASANQGTASRQTSLVFTTSGGRTVTIPITQEANEYVFTANTYNIELGYQGGTGSIQVTSTLNGNFIGYFDDSFYTDWFYYTSDYEPTLTYEFSENTTNEIRETTLILEQFDSGKRMEIKVKQFPAPSYEFAFNNTDMVTLSGGANAAQHSVNVVSTKSDGTSVANIPYHLASDSPTWIQVNESGFGENGLKITCTMNSGSIPRNGILLFVQDVTFNQVFVAVYQSASVSGSNYKFMVGGISNMRKFDLAPDGEGKSYGITSVDKMGNTVSWSILNSSPSWLSVTKNGENLAYVAYSNDTGLKRFHIIEMKQSVSNLVYMVYFVQEPMVT